IRRDSAMANEVISNAPFLGYEYDEEFFNQIERGHIKIRKFYGMPALCFWETTTGRFQFWEHPSVLNRGQRSPVDVFFEGVVSAVVRRETPDLPLNGIDAKGFGPIGKIKDGEISGPNGLSDDALEPDSEANGQKTGETNGSEEQMSPEVRAVAFML